mgnify:CR=1 FL=1
MSISRKTISKDTNKPYVCAHCGNGYVKESTLAVHMCEQKRRFLAKTEKHVQLGYMTYIRFYELSHNSKVKKSYDDFAKSPYYNAFVKFGSFLSNVNPLYLDRYIDYVVMSGVKLDHWCDEGMYYRYVNDLIKKETAEVAIERSIKTMIAWGDANNAHWSHYFKYVSPNRFVYDLKDGKISPWIVLNSNTGKAMLQNLNDEQIAMIVDILEPSFWTKKFKTYPADLELINSVVSEGKL